MKMKKFICGVLAAVFAVSGTYSPISTSAFEIETADTPSSDESREEKTLPYESATSLYRDTYYYKQFGDFEYYHENGYSDCYIINYLGSDNNIVIPSKVNNHSVYGIGDSAFKDMSFLKSVTVPNGIEVIGVYSFSGCTNLKKIYIPESVSEIRNYAFEGCGNVTIYGVSDSAAERYAAENSIKFTAVDKSVFEEDKKITDDMLSADVTLYCLDDYYKDYISMPNTYPSKYQIKLPKKYSDVSYFVSGNYVKTDSSGTVSVKELQYTDGLINKTSAYYNAGTSIVTVHADSDTFYYRFTVQKYSDIYCDQIINKYISDNITVSMTDDEKLEQICRFVSGYDYDYNFSDRVSMIITKGGDCWASTDLVNYMSKKLGFYAKTRDASSESIGVNMHKNSLVVLNNGNAYIVDCGHNGKAPRRYDMYNLSTEYVVNKEYIAHILEDGTLSIIEYKGSKQENLVIPKNISGKTVSAIADYVFRANTEIKTLTLPDTIVSIGKYAFEKCKNLSDINFSVSLNYVGQFAFENTKWLSSQPNGVVYTGNIAYSWKGTMPENYEIVLKEGTIGIAAYAFHHYRLSSEGIYKRNTQNLTYIKIPSSIKYIGDGAFKSCSCLKEVIIPEGCEQIGSNVFELCTTLEKAKLPESISTIGDYLFNECDSLTEVKLPKAVDSIGEFLFCKCPKIESVTLPEGLINLNDFNECASLREIYLPSTLCKIDNREYYQISTTDDSGSINYETIYREPSTFIKCPSIEKIELAKENTNYIIEQGALMDKSKTIIVFYPPNGKAKTYRLPDSVTDISTAFVSNTSLETIYINKNVNSITPNTFASCTGLKNIVIDSKNPKYADIDGVLFSKDKTELISYPLGRDADAYSVPKGTTCIGENAFKDCSSLKEVSFPESMRVISKKAFYNCFGLENIVIPEGVTTICCEAFYGCADVTSYCLPLSLTKLGGNCFKNDNYSDNKVRSVFYSGSSSDWNNIYHLNSYGTADYKGAANVNYFSSSENLRIIFNSHKKSGNLYYEIKNDGTAKITMCEYNAVSIAIPDTIDGYKVTEIDLEALRASGYLKKVSVSSKNKYYSSEGGVLFNKEKTKIILFPASLKADNYKIPEGIKTFEPFVFSNCKYLSEVTLPSTITEISENAFYGCQSLKKIVIPNTVKKINSHAFKKCIGLETVSIADSVTEINNGAFQSCFSLSKVNIPKGIDKINSNVFQECSSLKEITIPENIEYIGDYAFASTGLKKIVIPGTVYSVCSSFLDCRNLEEVKINEGVRILFGNSFSSCKSLKIAEIPDSVDYIDDSVFSNCTNVTLKGLKCSKAEMYAKKFYLKFESIGHSNEYIITYQGKQPTCAENGYTDGSHCTICGKVIKEQKKIPAAGHEFHKGKCIVCGEKDISYEPLKPNTDSFIIGDIDSDNIISSNDALLILRQSVGLENFTEIQQKLADVDKDGKITSADSLDVLRYSVRLKTDSSIGENYYSASM